jgi:hypothetical protein
MPEHADDVRVTRPHVEVGDYHEWVATGERWRYQDKGNTWWFELVCNNPDCDGQALVNEQALTALAAQASGGAHFDGGRDA